MNTRMLPAWIPVLALLMTPVTGGLAQNEPSRLPTPSPDTTVAVTPERTPTDSAQSALNNAAPEDNPLPPKIQLSPWTTEIMKLAQAGIEDPVMLAYVDNTAGTFNLGPDQIIYLNDLGVSRQLIAAMLKHDSELALGIRPVMASTVPASEPALQITLVANSDAAGQGSKQFATLPTASALVNTGMADNQSRESGPPLYHGLRASEPSESELEYTMNDELKPGGPSAPDQPRPATVQTLYPVREPYPVELTGPIIVIRACGRAPNTLLIEFSP